MTDTSDLPAQALEMGIDYNELVDIILKSADLKQGQNGLTLSKKKVKSK